MFNKGKIYFFFRIVISAVLIVSAVGKIYGIVDFGRVVYSYNLLPDNLIIPVTYLVPYLELSIGLMILLNLQPQWAYAAGIVMLTIFTVVSFIRYINGDISDCGCFGSIIKRQNDWKLFLENSVLVVLIIYLWNVHRLGKSVVKNRNIK